MVRSICDGAGVAPLVDVVATGGYGREELSPWSDIDITIIPHREEVTGLDQAVRAIFRGLEAQFRTTLGMKIGYALRHVSDLPGIDVPTRTGLLDSRLIWGTGEGLAQVQSHLMDAIWPGQFAEAKLQERGEQLAQYGSTPLRVEPHLKFGAGGLRCIHTAQWLRQILGASPEPTEGHEDLLKIRNLVHRQAGKARDEFSRSMQGAIAEQTGVPMFEIVEHLAGVRDHVHSEYLRVVRSLKKWSFAVSTRTRAEGGRLMIDPGARVSEAALAFSIGGKLGLSLPDQVEFKNTPPDEPREVLTAIATGGDFLRQADATGLLAALAPELAATRYLMPRDGSHDYTVFEHTLRAVENLDTLPAGFLTDCYQSIKDPAVLVLALLLHDAGKIDSTRPHSDSGADLARQAVTRWSMKGSEAEDIPWLVQEHLTMALFLRMRDIHHPETIADFTRVVTTLERLQMLTVLTYADIRAVNAEAWNPIQEEMLRELYLRAHATLESGIPRLDDPDHYRRRAQRHSPHVDDALVEAFLDSMPAHYMAVISPEAVGEHALLTEAARQGETSVMYEGSRERASVRIWVCSPDSPRLLNRILGVLYALDLSLIALHAHTAKGEQPVALDFFTVSFGGKSVPKATAAQACQWIEDVLTGRRSVDDLLRQCGKDPDRRQEIFRYQLVGGDPSILEFQVPRGRGMAFRLSRLIADAGWNIVAARVGQWAGQGAAAFYVTDADGRPLTAGRVQAVLDRQV